MINNKVQLTQITAGGGGTSKKNTTKALYGDMTLLPDTTKTNTKISLPGQSNASTGGLYGQVIGSGIAAPTYGNNGKLTPSLPTGISGATPTIKIDNSKYFDSGVVGTVGSLSGGGNKGGVTDEGVVKTNPKVDNSTFNNITSSKTPTTTKTSPLIEKLTNGNMASGIRDLISRLFGTKTTTTNTVAKKPLGTAGSGTTYAENIGMVTSNAENTGTASGDTETATVTPTATTETAATENNAGAAAESTGNTTESATEKPLTYAEYMEMLKSEAEASKKEADREAEIAKERAMVDAQSSYEQNKATYGANAEQMAQMGLQGGGYSDYLQSQAYAQKRSDVQQANAVESATKAQNRATYQDYVSSINQKLAEKALYEEQLAEQRAYEEKQTAQNRKDSLYASIWENATNPDNTYTAEAIRAIGEEYGLSDAQIESLTNIALISQSSKSTADTETSSQLLAQVIGDIASGVADKDYIDAMKDLGMTDEDYEKAMKYYNTHTANTASGNISSSIEAGELEDAENYIDAAVKDGTIDEDTKYKSYYDIAIKEAENCKSVDDFTECVRRIETSYNAGNLTSDDYANALKYVYARAGNVLPTGSYSIAYDKNVLGKELPNAECLRITLNGKTYTVQTVQKLVGDDTAKMLNGICGGKVYSGAMVEMDGQIYIYRTYPKETDQYKNGWIKVKTYNFWTSGIGTDNKSFYSAFDKIFETAPEPTAESHKGVSESTGVWKSYDEAEKAGYSNIRTEREFARGGNDKEKYGTYDKYLEAMYNKYVLNKN